MSFDPTFLTGGSSIFGGIVGAVQAKKQREAQEKMNKTNIEFQRETNAQNEALMRESWMRDDNAVQRKVQDLEASGLSKLLATGQGASNSGPISKTAPRQGEQEYTNYMQAIGAAQAGANVVRSLVDMKNQARQLDIKEGEMHLKAEELSQKGVLNEEKVLSSIANRSRMWQDYRHLLKFNKLLQFKAATLNNIMVSNWKESFKRKIRTTDSLDSLHKAKKAKYEAQIRKKDAQWNDVDRVMDMIGRFLPWAKGKKKATN